MVAKPSEMTSVTAWMMCKLLEKAGKSRSMLGRGNGVEMLVSAPFSGCRNQEMLKDFGKDCLL